jgi:peptidoglycan/LPS O-acetylase OafA/YrhL
MKDSYRYDIAVLRVLCIVVVVFFHAYGMMYANHFPVEIATMYQKYDVINSGGLINVAMPMFTFISGFLFGSQLINCNQSLWNVFKRKFKRLMVPFFVFAIFFMFTLNAASWVPLYRWSFSHLWYLPMLFWCFIVIYLIRPLIFNQSYRLSLFTILVLFALSLLGNESLPKLFGLYNVHLWICWFALGTWFYKHESMLKSKKIKTFVAICAGLLYIVLSIVNPLDYEHSSGLIRFTQLSGLVAMWYTVSLVDWQDTSFTKLIILLSNTSFGVYIFHNWLESFMISTTAQRVFPLGDWAVNYPIIFPLAFSLLAYLFSFVLTLLFQKTRIGKVLLG